MTFSQCGGSDDVVIPLVGGNLSALAELEKNIFFRLIFLIFLFLYIFEIELQKVMRIWLKVG